MNSKMNDDVSWRNQSKRIPKRGKAKIVNSVFAGDNEQTTMRVLGFVVKGDLKQVLPTIGEKDSQLCAFKEVLFSRRKDVESLPIETTKNFVWIPFNLRKNEYRGNTRGSKLHGFHGRVFLLNLHHNQCFSQTPERPFGGKANYTTVQMIDAFAINTNVNSGAGTYAPALVATTASNLYFAIAFSLQDLGQVAQLTAVFDQYRFDKVELKFVPESNAVTVQQVASPNNVLPSLWVVLDYDDSTAPASLAAVLQYDNVEACIYGEGLMVEVAPSNTVALYASGAFSGYQVQKAQWTDCANTAVAHYGVKGAVSELTALSTQTCTWRIFAKYYVSFRNTR